MKNMNNSQLKEFHENATERYLKTKKFSDMDIMIDSYNELLRRAKKINRNNPKINTLI